MATESPTISPTELPVIENTVITDLFRIGVRSCFIVLFGLPTGDHGKCPGVRLMLTPRRAHARFDFGSPYVGIRRSGRDNVSSPPPSFRTASAIRES